LKNSSGPSAPARATTSGPAAEIIAQAEKAYSPAMSAIAMYVARGTVRRGSRDSSLNTTDCSKPTKPVTAMTSSAPAPAPTRLPGSSGADEAAKSGVSRSAKLKMTTSTISATSSVASTLPLTATSRTPSTATRAQAASAMPHQGRVTPNHSANSGTAIAPKPPYAAIWKLL
jgi:hypothetical protein